VLGRPDMPAYPDSLRPCLAARAARYSPWPVSGQAPRAPSGGALQPPQQVEELGGTAHDELRVLGELRRRLAREHRDAERVLELLDRAKGVDVGRVVAGHERAGEATALEQLADGGALVRAGRRQHLEHLAAEARDEPLVAGAVGDLLELHDRRPLVG